MTFTDVIATLVADFIPNLMIPLLSLSGIVCGILLSYLAPQEAAAGKKYFVIGYRFIFVVLSALLCYLASSLYVTLLFLVVALSLIILDFKKPSPYFFLFHYLFFLVGYFAVEKNILIVALLFVYGLPVGTLLRMDYKK